MFTVCILCIIHIIHITYTAENVLVLEDGRRIKLTDFGTAAHIDDIVSCVSKLKGVTPHFTSPEVCILPVHVSNLSVYCITELGIFSGYLTKLVLFFSILSVF